MSVHEHGNPARDIPHYFAVFHRFLGFKTYVILVLAMFAAISESFGIVMVLPIIQNVSGESAAKDSPAAELIADILARLNLSDSMALVLGIIVAAFLLKGLLLFLAQGYSALLRAQLLRELKSRLFSDYSRMTYGYYTSKDTGYFINVINAQVNHTLTAFQQLASLASHLLTTFIYLVFAFLIAWRFGLMAGFLGLAVLAFFRGLNIYVRGVSRISAEENGRLAKLLVQFLHSFKFLTATGQSSHIQAHVLDSVQNLTEYEARKGVAFALTNSVREPISVVFISAILFIEGVLLGRPIGPLLISLLLFHRGVQSIMQLQMAWQGTLSYIGSVELVRDELESQSQHREPDGNISLPPLTAEIKFRDVYFRYSNDSSDVIRGVTLAVRARTSVALVGESGAGKSTLADLITLMLRPTGGQILIDGVHASDVELESWRRQIGYVSQETVIFDDTIANNICMWTGDVENDEFLADRVRQAAQKAHIAAFIEELPDGYQTRVGDRGLRLSGGQRQRLFIARELFRNPRLLILDEATSALDSESERHVQESIDALRGSLTVIIIAHRLSTIRNVDRVFVFEGGRLIESGGYDELKVITNSLFGRLVSMQSL